MVYYCCCSVTQLYSTLCDPMDCSKPDFPVLHHLMLKLMSIESVMPSSHLILCCPLLLLPPIPPSIRVFSSESTLCMRWPKYWNFSFSISLSNEHPLVIHIKNNVKFSLSNISVQSVVSNSYDPMNYSTPGFPVHHQLPELTQTHIHQVGDAIQPSSSVIVFSSCLQSFPASGSFQMS